MLLIVLFAPFAAFWILFLGASPLRKLAPWISIIAISMSLIAAIGLIFQLLDNKILAGSFIWIHKPRVAQGFSIDKIEGAMLCLVSFISLLVQWFSVAYMKKKKNLGRYYAYLSLFTVAMFGIIIADNLLATYICWEMVGLSSYLLIGFWTDREAAVKASRKAFLVNRVGDVGFLIGVILCFYYFDTFNFLQILERYPLASESTLTMIGICLFCGCAAKSAQFPFHVWLPDAMEGPTPVSALIHAATMVAVGVFFLIKIAFLLTPATQLVIAYVGLVTTLPGGCLAIFQNDLKKVLAYSTVSQLGLMMVAIGAGAFEAGLFHLFTHAFFKAGLFLAAGVVIHLFHGQDMQQMGGLRKYYPWLFFVYTCCTLSLVGFPLFSGFLSKELILSEVWHFNKLLGAGVLLSNFLTAFYMARQWYFVFFSSVPIHTSFSTEKIGFSIKAPLWILAIASSAFIFSLNPLGSSWLLSWWPLQTRVDHSNEYRLIIVAMIFTLIGMIAGFQWGKKIKGAPLLPPELPIYHGVIRPLYKWIFKDSSPSIKLHTLVVGPIMWLSTRSAEFEQKGLNSFINVLGRLPVVIAHVIAWIDKFIVDGLIHICIKVGGSLGGLLKTLSGRQIQNYFLFIALFIIIILYWMLII